MQKFNNREADQLTVVIGKLSFLIASYDFLLEVGTTLTWAMNTAHNLPSASNEMLTSAMGVKFLVDYFSWHIRPGLWAVGEISLGVVVKDMLDTDVEDVGKTTNMAVNRVKCEPSFLE